MNELEKDRLSRIEKQVVVCIIESVDDGDKTTTATDVPESDAEVGKVIRYESRSWKILVIYSANEWASFFVGME